GQPALLTASTNASAVWDTVASSTSTTLAAVTILLPTLALMEFVLSTVCPPASIVALTPTVSSAPATSVSKGSKSIDISMPWDLMGTSLHSSVTLLEVRSSDPAASSSARLTSPTDRVLSLETPVTVVLSLASAAPSAAIDRSLHSLGSNSALSRALRASLPEASLVSMYVKDCP